MAKKKNQDLGKGGEEGIPEKSDNKWWKIVVYMVSSTVFGAILEDMLVSKRF